MIHMEKELRDRFEEAFSKPPYEWEFTRYEEKSAWPGNYKNYDVQCAWEGYRAAYADLLERSPVVTDDMARVALKIYLDATPTDGNLDSFVSGMRTALETVWPIAAEPVAQIEIPDPQLCKFYGVSTFPQLVQEMEQHIAKLQDDRPKKPWEDAFPPRIG